MKVKKRSFSYAQMHFGHMGLAASESHLSWNLFSQQIYHSSLRQKFQIKLGMGQHNFFSKVFDYIFIFWPHVTNPRPRQWISKVGPFSI